MKYQIMNYELWGDDVNNVFYTGLFIDLEEKDTDKQLIQKLKQAGFIKKNARFKSFDVNGEFGYSILIDAHYKPFCELRPC
jgi:hypothetical protein